MSNSAPVPQRRCISDGKSVLYCGKLSEYPIKPLVSVQKFRGHRVQWDAERPHPVRRSGQGFEDSDSLKQGAIFALTTLLCRVHRCAESGMWAGQSIRRAATFYKRGR